MGIFSIGSKLAGLEETERLLTSIKQEIESGDTGEALAIIEEWLSKVDDRRKSIESGWD